MLWSSHILAELFFRLFSPDRQHSYTCSFSLLDKILLNWKKCVLFPLLTCTDGKHFIHIMNVIIQTKKKKSNFEVDLQSCSIWYFIYCSSHSQLMIQILISNSSFYFQII